MLIADPLVLWLVITRLNYSQQALELEGCLYLQLLSDELHQAPGALLQAIWGKEIILQE